MKKRILSIVLAVVMIVGMIPLGTMTASAATAVNYISYSVSNSGVIYESENSCSSYTTVSNSTTSWGSSGSTKWYYVGSNVTISNRITVSGTVNLILKDGVTLTASKGITVLKGNTLNIYAQSGGTGALVAGGSGTEAGYAGIGGGKTSPFDSGTVNIYGGKITVQGGGSSPGIGGTSNTGVCGAVTIYSGTVNVTGGGKGGMGTSGERYAVGGGTRAKGGSLTIYGGDVTLQRGDTGGAVGSGQGGFTLKFNPKMKKSQAGQSKQYASERSDEEDARGNAYLYYKYKPATLKNAPTAASNLTYNGSSQNLLSSAGTAGHGTMQYKVGSSESWNSTIPTAKDAGTYTVYYRLKGAGDYSTVEDDSFKFTNINIAQKEVGLSWSALTAEDLVYSGTAKVPTATATGVASGDSCTVTAALTSGKDNVNVGKFTYTVSGLSNSNYKLPTDKISPEYEITPKVLSETVTVMLDPAEYHYTGSAITPTVIVQDGDVTLTKDTDYTVACTDNTNVGNASATITFKGNYTGSIDKDFTIIKATPTLDVSAAAISFGQTLNDSALSGTATNGDIEVEGEFAWEDSTVAPAVSDSETTDYAVTFTPTDTDNYNTATCNVKVKVNKADYGSVTKTASGNLNAANGSTEEITLPEIPTGASYGEVSNSNTDYFTVSAISEGKLTVTSAKDWDKTQDGTDARTFTVTVNDPSGNHNDYTITVSITPVYHTHSFTGDYVIGTGADEGKHGQKCVNDDCTEIGKWETHSFTGDLINYEDNKWAQKCVCGAYDTANTKTGVTVPTATTGLVYNDEEKTGVADGTGYTVTDGKATNAGDYTATVTLKDGYIWADGTTDPKEIEWKILTVTDYHILNGTCDSLDGEGGKMGHQYKIVNDQIIYDVGRAIICLTEEQLNAITADAVTVVGGDLGKETTITLDCAYTYFCSVDGKHTAEDVGCAAFLIIDHDATGGAISGFGYYRVYNGSADSEDNFILDALYVNPNTNK